jgi:phosphoketolase
VLPVLHLNGYKIANPTVLARIPSAELRSLLEGYGYGPRFVEGSEPEQMHQLMAAALDEVLDEIAAIQQNARTQADGARPRWPMIVLRSPKGVDRAEGGRRPAERGIVPLSPGAAGRGAHQSRASARGVDALVPA